MTQDQPVEKIEKYLDLGRKPKKLWNTKLNTPLVVVEALETPAKALEKRLENTGSELKITELQKSVLSLQ